jgi:putative ABC transport system permease protein
LIGITFAVFLMMQMTAMFAGILNRAYSTSPISARRCGSWIPAVNTATSPIPMPDYVLDAVRSMDGVSYAVPLFIGGALVKLATAPINASMSSAWTTTACLAVPNSNRAIFRTSITTTRSSRRRRRIPEAGEPEDRHTFELNDHRGTIVGIARVAVNGLNGVPTLYTTYNRAIEYIPSTRFTLSYVLVQPKSDAAVAGDQAAGRQARLRGLYQG